VLATNNFPQDYVDGCRTRIDAQLAAYDGLKKPDADFDRLFFNHLVQVLDHDFVHRTRNLEGKDGNPLNEVRVLAISILTNGGVLAADKQIKLKPETSVLGLSVADEIVLDREQFGRLADAFFAEIGERFGPA
jgi:hypothetical protein